MSVLGKFIRAQTYHRAQEREQVNGTLPKLLSDGLPDQTPPAQTQEHVARAGVQVVKCQSRRRRNGHKDRVNGC